MRAEAVNTHTVTSFPMFDAYVEGLAIGLEEQNYQTRLLIASSVHLGVWQSSLVVTNVRGVGGSYLLTVYDNSGQVLSSES